MEMLTLANGYGQNYGFILYRARISQGSTLKFSKPVQDRVQVIRISSSRIRIRKSDEIIYPHT